MTLVWRIFVERFRVPCLLVDAERSQWTLAVALAIWSQGADRLGRCRFFWWMDGQKTFLWFPMYVYNRITYMEISSIIMVQWKMAICKFCNYYWRDLFFYLELMVVLTCLLVMRGCGSQVDVALINILHSGTNLLYFIQLDFRNPTSCPFFF